MAKSSRKCLNRRVLQYQRLACRLPLLGWSPCRAWQVNMRWTPNKVTFLRVVVGFAAVCLFGRGALANLTAVGLTLAPNAPGGLGRPTPREKKKGTPGVARPGLHGEPMSANPDFP